MENCQEVNIEPKSAYNRNIIEAKGKHIVLSQIKPRLETLLANTSVEEVHIIAGISLSIDADLYHDVWHGLNLVVFANKINVCSAHRWDVSGKDSDHTYTSDAGTDGNGLGIDGNDGYPGESGGNVLLEAYVIQHPERLTIISNGGNGSNGQDGGKGTDGVDGKGITNAEFEEKFPLCGWFLGPKRSFVVKKILKNMMDLSQSIKKEWCDLNTYLGDRIYFHVATHDGGEIIFSLYENVPIFTLNIFIVYMGSPGQRGNPGGGYGKGGQGGFPGEIIVRCLNDGRAFDIKTVKIWGSDGDNGKGGLNGKHGKNGWDMGLKAYLFNQLLGSPTVYGKDENSKLKVSYYEKPSPNRSYCPYKAVDSTYVYAEIKESRIDHHSQKAFMERNNTQARSDRKHHSKAIGKKTISRMQIVAKFSDYLKEIEEERLQLEKQRIEREHQQLVKQRLEREQQQLEKQRMEQEKQALEKRRLEQEHTEQRLAQQQIEEERQSNQRPQASQNRMAAVSDLLKSMGEEEARLIFEALKQKMEKPTRQIEEETQQIAQHPIEEVNQQQSQQQIEEENQQLPQQKFEEVIQHLSQQPIEEVEQQLPQQPIEEEIQQLPQQPIEEVEQQLPQQQIEEENQQLRQQQIQEENQQLPHQQIEEEYQQQSLTDIDRIAELRITRHINYAQDTTFQHRPDLVTFDTSVQDTAQGTIHGIPNNIDEWLQFRTEIHDIATIDENVERFETFKSQFNAIEDENVKEKLSEIEKILKIKFKWLVLNKILDEISNLLNARRFELTAQNVARCLEVTQKRNVTTPQVGFVTDHIFENSPEKREIIIKCITQSSESANNAIKRAVESFILEKSSTKDENDVLKQFYNKYHEVVTRANKILEKTESFKAELKKSKIQEAFLHQNVNVNDDAWPIDLVQLIRQDNTLRSLYDELVFMKKEKKRDWEKCCADEKIQDILKINIRQQGIMCKSYRILLAYLYDVNIRVYARDEDHEIVLIENHNPNSTNMTHILKTENEFIQLNINESHHQLEKERLHKDRIYRRILTEIDALPDIKHMQDYLNQKLYEQNSFNQEDAIEELGEDIVIEKIAAFFPEEERDNISRRMKCICPRYTGQEGVLRNILERFSFEGCHVLSNELCFLINSILAHTVEARQERYTFSWIVAAYNQCSWTDELMLLQLENYFKKQLPEDSIWRKYIKNIAKKEVLLVFAAQFTRKPCTKECVEDILHMLSSIPIGSVCLDQLELTEWPYVLKEYYWGCKLKSLITWDNELQTSVSFFVLFIENKYGKKLMGRLFGLLKDKLTEPTYPLLINVLSSFYKQKWNLCEDHLDHFKQRTLNEWIQYMESEHKKDQNELNISQIANIIKDDANTSDNIKDHLCQIEQSVENIHRYAIKTKNVSNFLCKTIKQWAKEFRYKEKEKTNQPVRADLYEEMLAVVDRAIELKKGFRLRDTQRLTVLALLTGKLRKPDKPEIKGTLAQVSTGEGKSLIVVATAIIKALLGEKVDIITSSSVLAQRDAVINKDIYELFGLSASHNCSEQLEQRKEAYSCNQIIYGDLGNFQRDYLLDRFYGKHVLGDRSFENVIVDEVDSMLLDKGNNMLYLSHDIAGMDKLESVYLFIWQMVNSPTDLSKDIHVEAIKQAVLNDMHAIIERKDIQKIDKSMDKWNALTLWERLVKSGIINDAGKLQTEAIDSNELDDVLLPEFTQYKDRLSFLLTSYLEREKCIKIPNYLKAFVERHLDSWISSAITALYMSPGQYYVVDVDRSRASSDRNANIIILDRDTGTDQVSSQWDEALHQFLQLKHGCKLSTQSLKAVFISNVTYLKKYKLLYGLTGTLGSQRERHLLEEIHRVDFVTVPTAKSKQFEEYEPIICSSSEDWKKQIRQEVNKLTKTDKRSVLIICETIRDVESFQMVFDSEEHSNVHTYVRDYETFTVAEGDRKLEPGHVIIATNLAGRGTDIKISDDLRKAGGLHVILTYLPVNIRIEEQAFGRAARCGDEGSGRMIIMVADGKVHNVSRILTLKQKRSGDELFRISAIKAYYETTIKTEENCFEAFNELYEKKMKLLANAKTSEPVKDILLQSCLDRWSFWLDEHKTLIEKASDEASKREVKQLLEHFLSQFDDLKATSANNWPAWVEENPMQMIKLGTYISAHDSKHRNTAMQLFGKVISSEPYFCEAAYYYRAYTRLFDNMNVGDFKKDLRMAETLFDDHIKYAMLAAGIISELKTTVKMCEGYEEQNKSLINLYSLFIQSIDDILGHAISSDSFVDDCEIKEDVADIIFKDLVRIGMIKKAEVVDNIPNDQIQRLHGEYGIPVDQLKKFLAQHRGPIDDKEFLKAIQESFSFSSRTEFWVTLINQNVLHSVERYVAINEERLKIIDPALMNVLTEMVDKGQLVKAAVKLDKHQILLIHEQQSHFYYEKEKLINMIGKTKYTSLEENGLLSCNEKATIDPSRITDCVFSAFDSITVQDITSNTRITTSEANKIIIALLERNVLEKRAETFVLSTNYDERQDILLPSFPVYEGIVQKIISSCFAYRLALRNIARHIEKEDSSDIHIDPQVRFDPHRIFFNELLELKIIFPNMVAEINESKIKEMYNDSWSKETLKIELAKVIGLPIDCLQHTEDLLTVLVDKKWIVPLEHNNTSVLTYKLSARSNRSSLGDLNCGIANSTKIYDLVKCYNVDVAFEKWFNDRLLLIETRIPMHISNVLVKSKSVLVGLKVNKFVVQSITELYDKRNFRNIDEMRTFIINGLEYVITLKEEKNVVKLLINTGLVLVFGAAQIAIGAIIWVAHEANGNRLMNEGFSDIKYAANALEFGYFSWQHYKRHKMKSLAYKLVATCSKYMLKLNATQFLRDSVYRDALLPVKEEAKRLASKTVQSISCAMANINVDNIVTDHLQTMLNPLTSEILLGVKDEVAKHKVSHNLQRAYEMLGENGARAFVDDKTNAFLMLQNVTQFFLPFTNSIASSIIQGIVNIYKQKSYIGKAMVFINQLSQLLNFVDPDAQIKKIRNATRHLLDSIDAEMERCPSNTEQNSTPTIENQELPENEANLASSIENQTNAQDIERFQSEVVAQWKTTLSEHVQQLFARNVVSPVLNAGVNTALLCVGNSLREIRESMRESKMTNDVNGTNKKSEDKNEQNINRPDMSEDTKQQLTYQYYGYLLKMMNKTRSSSLFATIIRENVPMDLTCVNACTKMVHTMLQAQNPAITGLTITVHGKNGIKQSFSSGTGGPKIILKLVDNHFTVSDDSGMDKSGNNSLYGALDEVLPDLQSIREDVFRIKLSDLIEQDDTVTFGRI